MKTLQLSIIVLFTTVLMGCNIEVSRLGNDQIGGQNPTETEQPTSTDRTDEEATDNPTPPAEDPVVVGASLEFTWEIPVERENNEQLFVYEIGGYEIEYRKVGESTYQTVKVEDGTINTYELTDLSEGDYEVRIAAYDVNGLYSKFSDSAVLPSS